MAPIMAQCPVCGMEMSENRLQSHVNVCLDSIARAEEGAARPNAQNPILLDPAFGGLLNEVKHLRHQVSSSRSFRQHGELKYSLSGILYVAVDEIRQLGKILRTGPLRIEVTVEGVTQSSGEFTIDGSEREAVGLSACFPVLDYYGSAPIVFTVHAEEGKGFPRVGSRPIAVASGTLSASEALSVHSGVPTAAQAPPSVSTYSSASPNATRSVHGCFVRADGPLQLSLRHTVQPDRKGHEARSLHVIQPEEGYGRLGMRHHTVRAEMLNAQPTASHVLHAAQGHTRSLISRFFRCVTSCLRLPLSLCSHASDGAGGGGIGGAFAGRGKGKTVATLGPGHGDTCGVAYGDEAGSCTCTPSTQEHPLLLTVRMVYCPTRDDSEGPGGNPSSLSWTALHRAAADGVVPLVLDLLAASGAHTALRRTLPSPLIDTNRIGSVQLGGLTPLDIACLCAHSGVAALLATAQSPSLRLSCAPARLHALHAAVLGGNPRALLAVLTALFRVDDPEERGGGEASSPGVGQSQRDLHGEQVEDMVRVWLEAEERQRARPARILGEGEGVDLVLPWVDAEENRRCGGRGQRQGQGGGGGSVLERARQAGVLAWPVSSAGRIGRMEGGRGQRMGATMGQFMGGAVGRGPGNDNSYGRSILDVRDGAGRTPLALAAQLGYTTCARVLLQEGACAGARDWSGYTPLMRALRPGWGGGSPSLPHLACALHILLRVRGSALTAALGALQGGPVVSTTTHVKTGVCGCVLRARVGVHAHVRNPSHPCWCTPGTPVFVQEECVAGKSVLSCADGSDERRRGVLSRLWDSARRAPTSSFAAPCDGAAAIALCLAGVGGYLSPTQLRTRVAPSRPTAFTPTTSTQGLLMQALASGCGGCGRASSYQRMCPEELAHVLLMDCLRALVESGCDASTTPVQLCAYSDGVPCTPLHAAAVSGCLCAVRLLTRSDAPSVFQAVCLLPVKGITMVGQVEEEGAFPQAWLRAVAGHTGMLSLGAWDSSTGPTPSSSGLGHDGRGGRWDRFAHACALRRALTARDGRGHTPAQAADRTLACARAAGADVSGLESCTALLWKLQGLGQWIEQGAGRQAVEQEEEEDEWYEQGDATGVHVEPDEVILDEIA